MFAPVLPGFEKVAASEAMSWATSVHMVHGGVEFQGRLSTIYTANLSMRTANRVLLRLTEFLAQNYPMLYDHARSVDWPAILGNCPVVALHVSSHQSRLRHRDHIRNVVYDAIARRLSDHGNAPELDETGTPTIHVRLLKDRCTISLDTSGEHLHKRGYRAQSGRAPIRETTAASLLMMAAAPEHDLIVDPFCGSGTFLVETDLLARNYPVGAHRQFAMEESPLHAPGTLRHIRKTLLEQAQATADLETIGFDVSAAEVAAANANARAAGASSVRVAQANALGLDFRKLGTPYRRPLLVANLPYGKRLGEPTDAAQLLEDFCNHAARQASGWDFAIVTPDWLEIVNRAFLLHQTIRFENGGIPARASIGRIR